MELTDKFSPLTDWKKEPSLRDLQALYNDSKTAHQDQMVKIQDWRDLMAAKGKYAPAKVEGRSSVQPKLVRKQAEWRYSALTEPFLSSEKLFQVIPVTFEDKKGAVQNELVLNWQFRTKIDKIKFVDDYVRAVVDEGTCICRVGWENQTTTVTESMPVFEYYPLEPQSEQDEQFMMLMDQLNQLAEFSIQNPRDFNETVAEEMKEAVKYFIETGIPVTAQIVAYEEVEVEKVLINRPTVDVLDPDDVYIDPTCKGNLDNALFVVQAYETSKHELLKNAANYQNLDKIKWGETSVDPDRADKEFGFKFEDNMKTKVTAYEYWGYHDINDDGIMVPIVATWIGDVLIRLEESPFPDGKLPFVIVPYLPVKRELFGEPDGELLRDNQVISGAVMRGMIDLMGRNANAQTGIPAGFLDVVNERKFKQGQDYVYNLQSGIHPQNAVHTHKFPEIPNSALNMLELQYQDAESMSGVKAFSGGISGSAYGQVAAGIRGALDATSKREMAILRRLARGVIEIGKKIIAMNSEFLSETEVVRVTNTEFVEIQREDLKGNYDLIVDISTAEVDDAKAQDLSFMAQTIGPIAGPQAALQLIAEIAELKRMPEVAKNLRNFRQEPSEHEMMMQQLELEKMQLEVEKLRSEIARNMADAQHKGAKGEKEALDTYEQGSGIKHQRDLEKQKAQAKGNQDLTVTKALAQATKQGEVPPNIAAAIGFNKLTELTDNTNFGSNQPDNQGSVNPVNNNEFIGR